LKTNLSKRGVTTTASIPHSGVSYRHTWTTGDHPKRDTSHQNPLLGFLRTVGMLVFASFVALGGFCSRPASPPKATINAGGISPGASPPWTPERIEKSGIFKAEPTVAPSPTPHVVSSLLVVGLREKGAPGAPSRFLPSSE